MSSLGKNTNSRPTKQQRARLAAVERQKAVQLLQKQQQKQQQQNKSQSLPNGSSTPQTPITGDMIEETMLRTLADRIESALPKRYVPPPPPSARPQSNTDTPWKQLPYVALKRNVNWIALKQQDRGVISVTDELVAFMNYVKLCPAEAACRVEMLTELTGAVQCKYPEATVNAFGSHAVGLSVFFSDLDMSILNINYEKPTAHSSSSSSSSSALLSTSAEDSNSNRKRKIGDDEATAANGSAAGRMDVQQPFLRYATLHQPTSDSIFPKQRKDANSRPVVREIIEIEDGDSNSSGGASDGSGFSSNSNTSASGDDEIDEQNDGEEDMEIRWTLDTRGDNADLNINGESGNEELKLAEDLIADEDEDDVGAAVIAADEIRRIQHTQIDNAVVSAGEREEVERQETSHQLEAATDDQNGSIDGSIDRNDNSNNSHKEMNENVEEINSSSENSDEYFQRLIRVAASDEDDDSDSDVDERNNVDIDETHTLNTDTHTNLHTPTTVNTNDDDDDDDDRDIASEGDELFGRDYGEDILEDYVDSSGEDENNDSFDANDDESDDSSCGSDSGSVCEIVEAPLQGKRKRTALPSKQRERKFSEDLDFNTSSKVHVAKKSKSEELIDLSASESEEDDDVDTVSKQQQPFLQDYANTNLSNTLYLSQISILESREQEARLRLKQLDTLRNLFAHIKSLGWVTHIELRSKAKVPIINIIHSCGVCVDISLGLLAKDTTDQVRALYAIYPQAFLPLSCFLKVFLYLHELDKPFTGGIGSYKLYVMIAYILSRVPTLAAPTSSSAPSAGAGTTPSPDLGAALLAFFKYFGNKHNLNACTHLSVHGVEADFDKTFRVDDCRKLFESAHTVLLQKMQDVIRMQQNGGNQKAFVMSQQRGNNMAPFLLSNSVLGCLLDAKVLRDMREKHAHACKEYAHEHALMTHQHQSQQQQVHIITPTSVSSPTTPTDAPPLVPSLPPTREEIKIARANEIIKQLLLRKIDKRPQRLYTFADIARVNPQLANKLLSYPTVESALKSSSTQHFNNSRYSRTSAQQEQGRIFDELDPATSDFNRKPKYGEKFGNPKHQHQFRQNVSYKRSSSHRYSAMESDVYDGDMMKRMNDKFRKQQHQHLHAFTQQATTRHGKGNKSSPSNNSNNPNWLNLQKKSLKSQQQQPATTAPMASSSVSGSTVKTPKAQMQQSPLKRQKRA